MNWTPKVARDAIKQGILPDIKVNIRFKDLVNEGCNSVYILGKISICSCNFLSQAMNFIYCPSNVLKAYSSYLEKHTTKTYVIL